MARVDSKKAKAGTEENIEYLENWLVELQELLPLEAQRDKLKKEVIPGLKKEIIESDKLVTPLSEAVEMVRPCPFSAGYGGELIVDIVFFWVGEQASDAVNAAKKELRDIGSMKVLGSTALRLHNEIKQLETAISNLEGDLAVAGGSTKSATELQEEIDAKKLEMCVLTNYSPLTFWWVG